MKFNIIIFTNTIWFIDKFKFDLINKLKKNNQVNCLYLREGPPYDFDKINFLKSKGVKFTKIKFISFFQLFFRQFLKSIDIKKNNRILVFTIGPIILSQILFFNQKKVIVYVLEGLGRVFSSRRIFYRLLKRLINRIYKYIFKNCKKIVTLNYSDATYLVGMKISTLDKISIIPGTGFECSESKLNNFRINCKPKYIDYIARLIEDKGFYSFLYTKLYINKYLPDLLIDNQFRVITPQSDIDNLTVSEKEYLNKSGIILKPYLADPYDYYLESKAIIMPTTYGEGLSRVLIESIFLEIPILVSRNNGTEELLPYDYKYFIKSFNPSCIANQLNNLLMDKKYIQDSIPTQKKVIEKYYSSESSIKALEEILFK